MATTQAVILNTTTNTSTGNQAFTFSLGGATPNAYWIYVNKATSVDSNVNDGNLCVGAGDGTNEWAAAIHAENGVGTTATDHTHRNDASVVIMDDSGAIDGQAAFVSFAANTITLNWSNAPAAAYRISIMAFVAVNAEAGVTSITSSVGVAQTITTGFEQDFVLGALVGQGTINTVEAEANFSVGWAVPEVGGVRKNGQLAYLNNDAQANVAITTDMSTSETNSGWVQKMTGVLANAEYQLRMVDFTATSFDVVPFIASASNEFVGWLAVEGFNAYQDPVNLVSGGTGLKSFTGTGFTPDAVLINGHADSGTSSSGVLANPSFGFMDGTSEAAFSMGDSDGAATSAAVSRAGNSNVFTALGSGGGSVSQEAAFDSMDSDGFTLDRTTASGNTRIVWLALGAQEDFTLTPAGIDVEVAFGTVTFEVEGVIFADAGIDISIDFGAPSLDTPATLSATGIDISIDFGATTVTRNDTLLTTGIDVQITFGAITFIFDQLLTPSGISVSIDFGVAQLPILLNGTVSLISDVPQDSTSLIANTVDSTTELVVVV